VRVDTKLERLPLAQFNPYATAAIGYSVASGAASLTSKVDWGASRYAADNRIVLDRLALGGAQGESLFLQRLGIPLTVALGLMRDLNGRISLGVPVAGDREKGMRIDLGSIVLEALLRAIVGAVASPLKLLGAVTMAGERIGGFAPTPIPFAPGLAELAADGGARVEELAKALASLPALTVALNGTAGAEDERALREMQVLADLEADQGFIGAVRNLPERRARNAIREALTARARGEAGALDAEYHPKLDEWVAPKQVTDARLAELGRARAERVQRLLGEDHAVPASRMAVGEPTVDRAQGRPQVTIALEGGFGGPAAAAEVPAESR
jgi:hypothetical protein